MPEQQDLMVSTEPKTGEDPIISLRAELDKERQLSQEKFAKYEEERKKTNKMLTEAQQDAAQAQTFLRSQMARINKLEEVAKSKTKSTFVEDWEQNPENAVRSRVDEGVDRVKDELSPINEKQRIADHKMALLSMRQKYPDFTELETRIKEISMTDPISAQWSWTEEGLEKLYRVAREEKLSKIVEEHKLNEEKDRAFTESSTGDNGNIPGKKKSLSPQERRLIKQLGLTEKQYLDNYLEGVADAEAEGR